MLKRHDILLKLDDQLLIDPRQLSVLVRSHKEGDTISVTYLRMGKQDTASIKLGAHEAPKVSEWGEPVSMPPNLGEHGLSREDMDRVLSLMNGYGQNWPTPPGATRPPQAPPPPNMREDSVDLANSNIVYTDDKGTS